MFGVGELRQLDANITLMIQADMLAYVLSSPICKTFLTYAVFPRRYHDPNEPAQIGFPDV